MNRSPEADFPIEFLPKNHEPLDPYFGTLLQLMRRSLSNGSSEFGLGLTLFSLAVSIRAANVIEIGRFKGFSTFCLASALRLIDLGWQEPSQSKQRPDVDYALLEGPRKRQLISIDPYPMPEAADLIREANLSSYVVFVNRRSEECEVEGLADLILIDGDHTYEACRRDCQQYVSNYLRPGGYFVLHDYFGWYGTDTINKSPIKRVAEEIIAGNECQHVLIDTGYMSFIVFRKPDPHVGC